MEKEQPRFLRVHPLQWVLWQDSRIGRVYTDIEIANNTKINHIIISFTDCYNAISIDRCPSKPKTEKDLLPFSNFPSCKPEFSSTTKTFVFFSLLKTQKSTNLQQMTGEKTPNLVLKRMLELFLKNSTTQENIIISRLKEDCKTYTKK